MDLDLGPLIDRARALAPALRDDATRRGLCAMALPAPDDTPYARRVLHADETAEVMVATWQPGASCAVHDHGGSGGQVHVLHGSVVETRYRFDADLGLVADSVHEHEEGAWIAVPRDGVHAMRSVGHAITLHVYTPKPRTTRVYAPERGVAYVVDERHGAWLPRAANDVVAEERIVDVAARRAVPVVLVMHTTHYREGSPQFARAARTLVADARTRLPHAEVRSVPVRWKRDFVGELERLADDARSLIELHFVGHSGMYGIMFGSTDFPEQLSPHEWRTLAAPFAPDGRAVFHACRTARWFAPFVARTLGIAAEGHHAYTTVSRRDDRFRWDGPLRSSEEPLHVIGCVGRKSHGLVGAVRKHAGLARAEPLQRFAPESAESAGSYDSVAAAYDEAFADIRVRAPEFRYVRRALAPLGRAARVLDIGCGNGALLAALSDSVGSGAGVDVSSAMIERARTRQASHAHLDFALVDGPFLPFPDGTFDAVVSFLSFRYLDWDPMLREVTRVLRRGGRFVVVDMVEKPAEIRDAPMLLRSAWLHASTRIRHRDHVAKLVAMTATDEWRRMLAYNPIRAEHEYRWYFESRFPGRTLDVLAMTRNQRVVGFDSGPKDGSWQATPLAFP